MEAVRLPAPRVNIEQADVEAAALRARHDPTAFAELYVAHREAVFRYLRARCWSDDEALELAAVTFERAFAAMPRYRTRGGGVLAWLLRIGRNAAVDEARRRRREASHLQAGPIQWQASLEDDAIASEERMLVQRALARLAEEQREAIALRYGARLTAREIGRVLGKSEEATQKLISRATARLREEFDDR